MIARGWRAALWSVGVACDAIGAMLMGAGRGFVRDSMVLEV